MKQQLLEDTLKEIYRAWSAPLDSDWDIFSVLSSIFTDPGFAQAYSPGRRVTVGRRPDGSLILVREAPPNPYAIAYEQITPFGEVIKILDGNDFEELPEAPE